MARDVALPGSSFQANTEDIQLPEGLSSRGIVHLRNNLAICYAAMHNSLERYPPPKCHSEALTKVLADIIGWVEAPLVGDMNRMFWLHGQAGIGKSTIAQFVAEECVRNNMPVASFFFSRGQDGRGSAAQFWQTIAFQIALSIPELQSKMEMAVVDDPTLPFQSPYGQFRRLLIDPFCLSPRGTSLTEDTRTDLQSGSEGRLRRARMACIQCRRRKMKVYMLSLLAD